MSDLLERFHGAVALADFDLLLEGLRDAAFLGERAGGRAAVLPTNADGILTCHKAVDQPPYGK